MLLSPLSIAVLALLLEEPMHPYRMRALMQERGIDLTVNVRSRSGMYAVIDRLTREGLIDIGRVERAQRRPERTVYRITTSGTEALQDALRRQLATPDSFPTFPAVLGFAHLLTPADLARQLSARAQVLRDRLEATTAVLHRSTRHHIPRAYLLEHEFLRSCTTAEINHIDLLLTDITTGELDWSRTPPAESED